MTSTIKTENNFDITTPPIWEKCVYQEVYLKFSHLINTTVPTQLTYIDGSLQERHNSSALAMELRLLHESVDMVSYRYPDSLWQKVDHLDLFDVMLLRRSSKRGLSLSCFQNDLCQIMKISTKGRPLSTPKRHGYLCRVHLVPKATTQCIKENKKGTEAPSWLLGMFSIWTIYMHEHCYMHICSICVIWSKRHISNVTLMHPSTTDY